MAKKIGILGSGMVGQALAKGFLKSGYDVKIGSRDAGKLSDFLKETGNKASAGSFPDAAAFGETIVLCCKGTVVDEVIRMAGKTNFEGKVVIDVTNPLLFEEEGKPPTLTTGFPESLGQKIQQLLPNAKVVKAFNIVSNAYMCNPKLQEGVPDMFIAGNDANAKRTVTEIASKWGWPVHDIGGIEQAALLEALAMIWIRYAFMNNHWTHAFKLLKK